MSTVYERAVQIYLNDIQERGGSAGTAKSVSLIHLAEAMEERLANIETELQKLKTKVKQDGNQQ